MLSQQNVPETVDSYGKINVTLRITGRRDDGYHTLHSLFMRTAPLERLTISRNCEDNVKDTCSVTGVKIEGLNILQRVLAELRSHGMPVPPLQMVLEKNVPPCTGLGCGSGNAAALFQWLNRQGWAAYALADRIGADIPFFLQEAPLALVSGIGGTVESLAERLNVQVLLVIPYWRCSTSAMFRLFDEQRHCDFDHQKAQAETHSFLLRLLRGEKVGLLPNDFEPLLTSSRHEYRSFYSWCADQGALAWGLSGSGSAAFVLWRQDVAVTIPTFKWIDSTILFSTAKESC